MTKPITPPTTGSTTPQSAGAPRPGAAAAPKAQALAPAVSPRAVIAGKASGLSALGSPGLASGAAAKGREAAAAPAANEKAADPPVSRQTIDLVQASWGKVMPISDAAAALFYDRLFELDPSVRPLFKSDIAEQKKKLMQTLTVAVDGLNNLDRLVPVLQSLGARHAGYMVVDEHYDTVGEALLWTLREGLGDDFTSDVETAWTQVYTLVAGVMKKAAADQARTSTEKQDSVPLPLGAAAVRRDAAPATTKATPAAKASSAAAPAPKAEPAHAASKASDGGSAEGRPSGRTIALVQSSWAKVMPISDAAASLFYDRLFELDPSVRPLFKPEMREQKKKLMQTLTVAVDGLSNLERLVPVLRDLGIRHTGYMVADHHYDVVGEALLWTLREGLGDDFTDEVEAAWTEIYGLVAGVMKKAAAEHSGGSAGAQHTPTPAAPTAAPAAAPAAAKRQTLPSIAEEEEDTLHYDSSRRPPIIEESSLPAKTERERRPAPTPAAGRPSPVAPSAVAVVPVEGSSGGFGMVVPLSGKDVTLNVRLTLDGPLPTATAEAAQSPASTAPGGIAPALLLAALCSIASMAIATMAPGLAAPVLVRLGTLASVAVAVLILVLILTAFGLGYLWGRGRQPVGSRPGAAK